MKFTYDPKSGHYFDANGREISDRELRRIQADSESNHVIEMIAIAIAFLLWRQSTGQVARDEILTRDQLLELAPEEIRGDVAARVNQIGAQSSREFQARMLDQIEKSHLVNTVLASGGFAATTIAAWSYARGRIQDEQAAEVRFAAQVVLGRVSQPQTVNRASMYSQATYSTFSGANDIRQKQRGVIEARRILDEQAEHCEECPSLATEEWQRIEEVRRIGETPCRARCRCFIEYRKVPAAQPAAATLPAPDIQAEEAA